MGNEQFIDGEIISRSIDGAQQLPQNLMLLKMENESIMSMARVAPREPELIIARLQKFLDAYPAAADNAIYAKPVGKVDQITCAEDRCGIIYEVPRSDHTTECPACGSTRKKDQRKVQKFAEGLSIRAAESIRSEFGYTRLSVEMEVLDDGKVRLSGTLIDYAAGNMTSDERVISPMYKAYDGSMKRTPDDRFLNVVVKAEKAKLRRDIILDSVPGIVKAMYRDACELIQEQLLPDEVVRQKIIPAFASFGLTQLHLEKILGRPLNLGWLQSEQKLLRKMLASLKSGETTVAELLQDVTIQEPGSKGDPTKAATGDALEEIKRKRAAKSAETVSKPAETKTDIAKPVDADPPESTQDATDAPDDSAATSTASDEPDELPEPYSDEEEAEFIDWIKFKLESTVTQKRCHELSGEVNDNERLSTNGSSELFDLIAAKRKKLVT